ncbi:type II toxin-antitoxin system HicA family toxin [Microcystis aeruginosa BLCCF158]|uniref:Type II toxin-antitoxin system HicA family toxin n=1 Tax=Microcystis aeruginosa BLCC-F158 TaxID=2755316 RepID=A0A841V1L3_MICAE|nr:type II toxin-antitoxin system HicA family toxin [Microcystis aeruginosa]MBC1196128.1 type II toxin-antitoxin system HicA family toxin [Microcystis aeruginosa BLCC-F158]
MKSISSQALCEIIERYGWQLKRISSSHHIYTKQGMKVILSVPIHGNKDLPIVTLKSILKDADLTEDDLR